MTQVAIALGLRILLVARNKKREAESEDVSNEVEEANGDLTDFEVCTFGVAGCWFGWDADKVLESESQICLLISSEFELEAQASSLFIVWIIANENYFPKQSRARDYTQV